MPERAWVDALEKFVVVSFPLSIFVQVFQETSGGFKVSIELSPRYAIDEYDTDA